MDPETFVAVQRALAEPKRLEILEAIRRQGSAANVTCSCVLSEMNVSQSTFSHHIAALIDAGLVNGKREGRHMILSVNDSRVQSYLDELKKKMLG